MKQFYDDFNEIKCHLKKFNECELAFIYGENLSHFPNYTSDTVRESFINHALCYIKYFVIIIKLFFNGNDKCNDINSKVLFFSNTRNQWKALSGTIKHLGIEIKKVTFNNATSPGYSHSKVTIRDIFLALSLMLYRSKSLYRLIKNDELKKYKKFRYYHYYLLSYIYLSFFKRVCRHSQLGLVVMSNDHNVENRCLQFICELSGIKSVYIQHAHVSKSFPSLRFNYSLLDGESSFNQYGPISDDSKSVYLCGVEKLSIDNKLSPITPHSIGIAINNLDSITEVEKLLRSISSNMKIILRFHPGHSRVFIKKLTDIFNNTSLNVNYSIPRENSLEAFLATIDFLIAGNSSIHLESVINGVPSLYYDMAGDGIFNDYYGFVESGLIYKIESCSLLSERVFLKQVMSQANSFTMSGIKKLYSETYDTQWFGRESELRANIILSLLQGEPVSGYMLKRCKVNGYLYKIQDV